MSKHIYWCSQCAVPIIERQTCPLCGNKCTTASTNGICNPVYLQERKLLSLIWKRDVSEDNVWYLGSSQYLINGVRTRLPYIDFMKHTQLLPLGEQLRVVIAEDDTVANEEEYIAANSEYLMELVYEAEEYVKKLTQKVNAESAQAFVPTVSFSGGKDSTVVSRLVRDALQDESVIHFFGDTTLEFPCTHLYVDGVFRLENPFTPMIPSETTNDFFKLCRVFGPPSKFERWCCTIFKTSNLNNEYQNLTGNSLSFLGIRRGESRERQRYERTQDHSKIGSQINAMPIIDWDDCDVWLYIVSKKIAFNQAYRWGYKRVGCWCCPNNSNWSSMLTEMYFPDLAAKWKGVLYEFAEKTHKDDPVDYVENGRWKTRKGASGLESRNVTIADTPCNLSDRARNVIIKKKLTPDVLEFFKPFGSLDVSENEDGVTITITEKDYFDEKGDLLFKGKKVGALVIRWGTPVIKVLPERGVDITLLVNRIKCQMRKYQYCIRCTACDSICPNGAIRTMGDKRYIIDENLCAQNLQGCSRCIAKFYNGCLTCQVLAGKKTVHDDGEDEV